MARRSRMADWLDVRSEGLLVVPAGVYIDPVRSVDRAIVTHGHADHARPGHGAVLATPETLAIMRTRLGDQAGRHQQPATYGETVRLGNVAVTLFPAGHVLGSAQVLLEHAGTRVVVSGDYKRQADPTCTSFDLVPCDLFITEATFGLPVFRHPPAEQEVTRLLAARALHRDRCVLLAVYGLGKCQRMIALLRAAGHDAPIYLHGALQALCRLYTDLGIKLGPLHPVVGTTPDAMAGAIVLAPPSATRDRWMRRLPDPMVAQASGWMRVRQRAKQRGVELPLVVSDHADWDELCRTILETGAEEVWVTHGREEALVHFATQQGIRAQALSMVGFEEDGA